MWITRTSSRGIPYQVWQPPACDDWGELIKCADAYLVATPIVRFVRDPLAEGLPRRLAEPPQVQTDEGVLDASSRIPS